VVDRGFEPRSGKTKHSIWYLLENADFMCSLLHVYCI